MLDFASCALSVASFVSRVAVRRMQNETFAIATRVQFNARHLLQSACINRGMLADEYTLGRRVLPVRIINSAPHLEARARSAHSPRAAPRDRERAKVCKQATQVQLWPLGCRRVLRVVLMHFRYSAKAARPAAPRSTPPEPQSPPPRINSSPTALALSAPHPPATFLSVGSTLSASRHKKLAAASTSWSHQR